MVLSGFAQFWTFSPKIIYKQCVKGVIDLVLANDIIIAFWLEYGIYSSTVGDSIVVQCVGSCSLGRFFIFC